MHLYLYIVQYRFPSGIIIANTISNRHKVHRGNHIITMNRAVFVPPMNITLVFVVPKASFPDRLIKTGLQFFCEIIVVISFFRAPQLLFNSGPFNEGMIELCIHQCIFIRRPDNIQPVTSPFLLMAVGHHFYKPVIIAVSLQYPVQSFFT